MDNNCSVIVDSNKYGIQLKTANTYFTQTKETWKSRSGGSREMRYDTVQTFSYPAFHEANNVFSQGLTFTFPRTYPDSIKNFRFRLFLMVNIPPFFCAFNKNFDPALNIPSDIVHNYLLNNYGVDIKLFGWSKSNNILADSIFTKVMIITCEGMDSTCTHFVGNSCAVGLAISDSDIPFPGTVIPHLVGVSVDTKKYNVPGDSVFTYTEAHGVFFGAFQYIIIDPYQAYYKPNSPALVATELVSAVEINNGMPLGFSLTQNYPNPFNPVTTIKFSIPKQSNVTIKIYDLLGREITTLVNEEKSIGNYSVEFNASFLSSGIYFYRMQAGDFIETKKLILMK